MKQSLLVTVMLTAAACSSQNPSRVEGKSAEQNASNAGPSNPGNPSNQDSLGNSSSPDNSSNAANPSNPESDPAPAETVPPIAMPRQDGEALVNEPLDPIAYPPIVVAGGTHGITEYDLRCSHEGTKYECVLQQWRTGKPVTIEPLEASVLLYNPSSKNGLKLGYRTEIVDGGVRFHFQLPEGANGNVELRNYTRNPLKPRVAIASVVDRD